MEDVKYVVVEPPTDKKQWKGKLVRVMSINKIYKIMTSTVNGRISLHNSIYGGYIIRGTKKEILQ